MFEQHVVKKDQNYGCIIGGWDCNLPISENSPFWKPHSNTNTASIAPKICTMVDVSF